MTNIITHKLLKSWIPCTDGYRRFCELFPEGADLKTAAEGLHAAGHTEWAIWLFDRCRERRLFPETTINGFMNTGHQNTGHRNTGHRNTGHRNTGHQNTGDWNTGDWNTGHQNTGDWNTGHQNTGDRNTGHRNTGDWNAGSRNVGHFNTATPDTILVFNKPCSLSKWEAAYKPGFLFFALTEWIFESNMTEEEKKANPNFHTTGGYLKTLGYKETFKKSWDNADKKDRERVRDLPNFDADVFYEISGIDLREGAK